MGENDQGLVLESPSLTVFQLRLDGYLKEVF